MLLKDLLAGCPDDAGLLGELRGRGSQGEGEDRVETEPAGARQAVERLEQIAGQSDVTEEGLEVVARLLRLLNPDALNAATKRALLESPAYVDALTTLLDAVGAAHAAPAGTGEHPPGGAESAARADGWAQDIAYALHDLASMSGKGADGKKAKGKALYGARVVPQLAAFIRLPTVGAGKAQEAATTGLLDYCTSSQHNCQALLAAEGGTAAVDLFTSVLSTCGSAAQQLDLVELLYECGQQGALREEHRGRLPPALNHALGQLLEQEEEGLRGDAFTLELRKLAGAVNRGRGGQATVASLPAQTIVVGCMDGLANSCKWVDFGLRKLALTLRLPGEDEGEQVVADFNYSDIQQARLAPAEGGATKLALSLTAMPRSLTSHSETFNKRRTLDLKLRTSDLASLPGAC